jgi:hypothetical protein
VWERGAGKHTYTQREREVVWMGWVREREREIEKRRTVHWQNVNVRKLSYGNISNKKTLFKKTKKQKKL